MAGVGAAIWGQEVMLGDWAPAAVKICASGGYLEVTVFGYSFGGSSLAGHPNYNLCRAQRALEREQQEG